MAEKTEYSFDELDSNGKTNAVFDMDTMVRTKLGLFSGARTVDRPMIECIISKLDPVFDKNGRARYYTKKYTELTIVLLKDIYEQCS